MLIAYLSLSLIGALVGAVLGFAIPTGHGLAALLVAVPLGATLAVLAAAGLRLATVAGPRPVRARVRGRLAPVWTAHAHG